MKDDLIKDIQYALSVYAPLSKKAATALAQHTKYQHFKFGDAIEKENESVKSKLTVK